MLGHERVSHFASLAKYAVAFLRNSHGCGRELVAEGLRAAL